MATVIAMNMKVMITILGFYLRSKVNARCKIASPVADN